METPVRLNLGSGRHCWPNAINVDYDERADVVSDVCVLSSFDDESVDEIYAIHLIEHLDRMEAPHILKEWARVLKPGGKLILEFPLMEKIAQLIVEGEKDLRLTLLGIFGDIRENNPNMLHRWCYTQEDITRILTDAGFSVTFQPPMFHMERRDIRVIGVKNE